MRRSVQLIIMSLVLSIPVVVSAQSAAPPADQVSPQMTQFDTLFAERTQIIENLKRLDQEYPAADAARREAIVKQAREMFDRLTLVHSQLLKLAETLYVASSAADPRTEALLIGSCQGHFDQDDYEESLRLAKLLIIHGSKEKGLFLWGGAAAFNVGDLDLAQKYLATASDSGLGNMLDPTCEDFLKNPGPHRDAWKKEQEIRAREAAADDLPRVLIKTSKGDVEIELFENEAPNSTANFLSLVEQGYYNGLPFHRVLPGFMAQGGDNGRGGPGYNVPCECYRPDYRKHFRGTLSMAHAGRDTGSAQFFLTFVPTKHLDGHHTAFGRVVKGMDVLAKIRKRDPSDPQAAAIEPDKIVEAKVLRKRPHPYVVKKVGE